MARVRRLLGASILAVVLGSVAVPAVLVAQDVLAMGEEEQKDWLTNFVQDRLSTPERQIRISNLDGVLGSDVSVREITISDQQGVWLKVNNASLNWNQAALFTGRLEVRSLRAESIDYLRNPIPAEGAVDLPAPEASSLEIPEFPVAVQLGELAIPRVSFGESVFGLGSEISLSGSMLLEGGNLDANLDITRLDGPGGELALKAAYRREDASVDLGLVLSEPENGVLANVLNIEGRPAMQLTVSGKGPISGLDTELSLLANGQEALRGVATVRQQPEGLAINAQLDGPLSTLMAETYRPFFGPQTQLTAQALVRSEGGLDISRFTLAGGQLALTGEAQTSADNFLTRLVLTGRVADASGVEVVLPVPGGQTQLQQAGLEISYGTDASQGWTASLGIDGLSTAGFGADRFALDISGVAANLDDPTARRVTFNGDGSLTGIAADPAAKAALGDRVAFGLAGSWVAGEPVQLAELRVVGEALTAALSGQLDGLDFRGDIALDADSIAPFSGLAERDLGGAVALRASGLLAPLSGGFDLSFDGTGTDLAVGDATADRLLAGTVNLSGRLARTEAGIAASDFRIANAQVQFGADGTIASDSSDFTIGLDLTDLGLLTEEASGALRVRGSARATAADEPLVLVLDAQVPRGTLSGYQLSDGRLGVAGSFREGLFKGDLSGTASLDGALATLSTHIETDAERQALSDLAFAVAGANVTGAVTRMVETGLIDGRLDVDAPNVSRAAALLLQKAEGAVSAALVLAPQDGRQGVTLTANASDLRVNDIRVGAAQIAARVGDLFGVPSIDGTASASAVAVGGISVDTLDATASRQGAATEFAAQARLANGTTADLAGALAPLDNGYRLLLSRLALAQGDLRAQLAQPTELVVQNDSVGLSGVQLDVGSGRISATGTAGANLDLVVDIADLPLSIANTVSPGIGLGGTVNGRAVITGPTSEPAVRFEAQGSGLSAAAIAPFGIAPVTVTASGTYGAGVVQLAALSASGAGGLSVNGSGRIPLSGGGLDVRLEGSAPLALGNRFVAERGAAISGTATFDARIAGSLAQPSFGGSVRTSNAGYVDPELNLRLIGISGEVQLDGTSARVVALNANLATGGSVSASGTVGLSGGFPANMAVTLTSARYADSELFVATMSGALTLTGNLAGTPLLAGDVLVERADITVPESLGGGAQLIDVEHRAPPPAVAQTLARAQVDRSGAPIPQNRSAGLLLDVRLNAPNQIFVRGRGLDAEVSGSVRLAGPLNDIQPVGAFTLTRGRLAILGQRLTFESGSVTLVGDLDPMLNFVARTEGNGITVLVILSGRVSDLDVQFTSNPTLPQDEVLSRLIFGRSMGELSPLQLAQLAGAAAELVGGGGGGGLVDGLRAAAGLADLDVVTDSSGNVGVQAGTYLQDNVYLGVQAGANGQSKVTINLDVTDDLVVKGSAGQNGDTGLGVFYEKDY